MYYERLSLEVIAARSHWQIVNPPILTGRSGVMHRFDFMAMNGQQRLAFDICERPSETDVIKTFIKKFDTGVSAYIVSLSGKMAAGAGKLASEYGLKILHSNSIESAFRTGELEPQSGSHSLAAA